MSSVLEAFQGVDPVVKRCENGGWLAVAPASSPLHIGVFAWSVDEARNRFFRARKAWCDLLAQSGNEAVADSRS
jgi:hypothetical protein